MIGLHQAAPIPGPFPARVIAQCFTLLFGPVCVFRNWSDCVSINSIFESLLDRRDSI
jgi:hypothetical protein